MTRPASIGHIEYLGDGASTVFTYPFKIDAIDELEVRLDGAINTDTIDFTVDGVGNDSGGEITYFTPPEDDAVVSLRLVVPFEQLLDIIPNGALPSQAIEFRFDQIVKMIQQLDEMISRKVGFPVGAKAIRRDVILPEPGEGKVFGWDGIGETITLYDPHTFTVDVDPLDGIVPGVSVVELTASPGALTLTASALAPAGARITAVLYYCSVAFSTANGLSSIDIGGFGVQDGWGAAVPITFGAVTSPANFRRGDEPVMVTAGDIILTANGGSFAATGKAIITVYWETFTARTTV